MDGIHPPVGLRVILAMLTKSIFLLFPRTATAYERFSKQEKVNEYCREE